MANYAQMNPGKYHLGYRFPTPVLIEKLNEAKDACKEELRDTHVEIVAETKANMMTESHDSEVEIHDEEEDHAT